MVPAGTRLFPARTEAERIKQVAIIAQDRTMHREVLDVLAGRYDLTVLRQFRDLSEDPAHQPALILMDSTALLALDQAEKTLQKRIGAPIVALVDEAHLQTIGPLLAERVHDFLVSPFTATELLLRVSRVFRRPDPAPAGEFTIGAFRINLRTGEAYHGQRPLPLTRKEVALLYALARRMGATVTRDELLSAVWGAEYDGTSNVLDVHIRSLRRKIEPVPQQPQYILTVRGIGYRFGDLPGATHLRSRNLRIT